MVEGRESGRWRGNERIRLSEVREFGEGKRETNDGGKGK
jgi:hypothetical protein